MVTIIGFLAFLISQALVIWAFTACYRMLREFMEKIPEILAQVRKQGNQEVFSAFLEGVSQARKLEIERINELASDSELVEKLKKPVRRHV